MFQIRKSEIDALPFDFTDAVAKHVAALQSYRHTLKGDAPTAHPLVEMVIGYQDQTVVAKYEIVDDTPTLEQRKAALIADVNRLENEAANALMSPARRLLLELNAADAREKKPGQRTADETKLIEDHAIFHRRLRANARHGAEMQIQIEALTADNIGAWTPAPFPSNA